MEGQIKTNSQLIFVLNQQNPSLTCFLLVTHQASNMPVDFDFDFNSQKQDTMVSKPKHKPFLPEHETSTLPRSDKEEQ
jgi:hypothetical protein